MSENLPSLLPSNNDFQLLQVVARNAAASGLYSGVGSEQKILMVLLAAQELGIKPMMALNGGIWNIQGKIEISARLMNAMIRKAGHSIVIKQLDNTKCVLEGKRTDNGDTFSAQFSIEDAAKAGLTNRATWKSYTEDMLYSRAMSRLARRLFPDVIGTAYVEGEIRDAKCEVIETIKEEIIEDKEEEEQILLEYCNLFEEQDRELIKAYMIKWCSHFKKSMKEALNEYSDLDKFESDFSKWKKKQLSEKAA